VSADAGCAVVITGHEIPDILAVADSVVWLPDGTTQLLGSPAQAAEDWRFRRDYLGARVAGLSTRDTASW